MNRIDISTVLSVALGAPIFVAWGFAFVDIARRRDLNPLTKIIYAAILFFVVPATLFYLLARPTSIVGHRVAPGPLRKGPDWRAAMMKRIEAQPGSVPVVSRSEERDFVERISALRQRPLG